MQDAQCNVTTPGQRVRVAVTLDDGTQDRRERRRRPGAPNVNLATTNFTADGGDSYPFRGRDVPVRARAGPTTLYPYQASLFDFITTPVAGGGLGGVVTAARYPDGGTGRIKIRPP